MANNIVLDAGSGGATVVTDEFGGSHYPVGKIVLGAEDAADGFVADTEPMPVGGNTAKDGSGTKHALLVDSDGHLQVDVLNNALADEGAFTHGTTRVVPAAGVMDETSPSTNYVTEGQAGVVRMSANRALYFQVRDGESNAERGAGVDASNNLKVIEASGASILTDTNTIAGAIATLGTGTYSEGTTTGAVVGAVRNDVLAALANTDNEIAPFQVNASGALYIQEGAAMDVSAAALTIDTFSGANFSAAEASALPAQGVMMAGDDGTDTHFVQLDTSGNMKVSIEADSVGIGGGTEYVDDTATHASGTTTGKAFMAAATPTDGSVDANDLGVLAMSLDRRLHVDADITAQSTGDITIADGGNSITVDSADLSTIAGAVGGSEMQVDIVAVTPDLMLGTDFSNVLGTASLITATQADAIVNTVDTVNTSALAYVFNGTTWDRVREGGEAGSILVDLGANNNVTIDSGTVTANAGTGFPGVATDGSTAITTGWQVMGTDGTDAQTISTNTSGHVNTVVAAALPAGTNSIGKVIDEPTTSGGYDDVVYLDLGNTGQNPKASAGQLYGYHVFNSTAAKFYLKFYNKATAPTSADTPTMVIGMPGNASGAAANVEWSKGIAFGTGIGVRCVTGVADADTTSPATNGCVITIFYK